MEVLMTELKPRWGQPITGIISLICFTLIAWGIWYIFSDPRGIVKAFPYPFVMYLAMMILVGLWQHMFCGDWPFQNMGQPLKGIILTVANLAITWFVIHIVFYKILGLGFNFLSQDNLNALATSGTLAPDIATKFAEANAKSLFGQRAVVCFVLIGFFTYPFVTILFGKWPVRPSDLAQPMAGLAEIGWCSLITLFFYTALIVPFWGMIYGKAFGSSIGLALPWWNGISGISHVHWVFGWWEWMIVALFMTANVWRMKPWSSITLPQPLKGLVSFFCIVVIGYVMAIICVKLAPLWLGDNFHHIQVKDAAGAVDAAKTAAEQTRFLWYHAAEVAGFTLIPFLAWHHYFDDMVPMAVDSWAGFWFRTAGVMILCVINYIFFYYIGWGQWGLGNPHWDHKFVHGESLVWNFWWIIPLLWNEWFFHKWPFYVHKH
ncbi:MAG: hypothetical protein HQK69_00700 [Desulfamplus sp.]|nr:hypothetical protein [Desulfamplus sp.]